MTDGTDMGPGPSGSQLEPHFHHPVLTYLLNSIDYHSYSHPKTNDAIYFCVAKVGFPVGVFRAQVVEHMDESPELQLESSWEFRWRFWEIGTNMTEKIDPLRKRACLQWWRVSCWLYTVRVELLTVLLVLTSVTNIRTITMAVVFIENLSLMPQLLETPHIIHPLMPLPLEVLNSTHEISSDTTSSLKVVRDSLAPFVTGFFLCVAPVLQRVQSS